MSRTNPYRNLPASRFWRTAVAEPHLRDWAGLYSKRFEITPQTRISAAGSCFAQHIGSQFKQRRCAFQDFEPPPPGLPADLWRKFGYNMFSARYGNVYTPRQFHQLLKRAFGTFLPEIEVWEENGRFFDPFRPSIEDGGFASPQEVLSARDDTLAAVRRMASETDVFVFTLGLTEAWLDQRDGAVYPVCPGTVAGVFDPSRHVFKNFSFAETLEDMSAAIEFLRSINPAMKFLLTVSPVPLAATASPQHVLVATTYSKSVLRAVAGELYANCDHVDYFPSYEIISSFPTKGAFYEPNWREVTPRGVQYVMKHFFTEHSLAGASVSQEGKASADVVASYDRRVAEIAAEMEAVCDEGKLDGMRSA